MRLLSLILVSVFMLFTVTLASAASGPVTLKLPAMNGSGESGTISLTPSGSNITEVVIVVNNQPLLVTKYQTIAGQQVIDPSTYGGAKPQLGGIYSGSCSDPTLTNPPNLGALTPYGPNVTSNEWLVVKKPVAEILAGHYIVAVHKDATATSPLVACAELTNGPLATAATALPKTGGMPLIGLGVLGGFGLLSLGLGSWLRRRPSSARPTGDSQTLTPDEEVRS